MADRTSPLPWLYKAFFLWLEPVATAVGAYYAWLRQHDYMHLTHSPTAATTTTTSPLLASAGIISTRESIVLNQLANMYLVFALNEALVLRATSDLRVWRVFLLGLLIADFGHIYSVCPLGGLDVYYRFWLWNSMYWGNLGFVYIGASMRIAFLLGVGLPSTNDGRKIRAE